MPQLRLLFLGWLLASGLIEIALAAGPARSLVTFELEGVKIEGAPLQTQGQQVTFLDRSGRLLEFNASQAKHLHQTTLPFKPLSSGALRSMLHAEFGKAFEVSGTGHYLVVHPIGQKDVWAQRFEDLYRSFVHYFSVRGFKLNDPEFPLVAVVLPDRRSFDQYAARERSRVPPGVIGYYSPTSNRIVLYDLDAGAGAKSKQKASGENLALIVHEATHQTAFNTGIHNRFGPSPRWVVEGLGTMFEAPGVWDSRVHPKKRDRINAERHEAFLRLLSKRPADRLTQIISHDRLFDADPEAAYAEAWALTFFLVETRPRDYAKYLAKTAKREAFRQYSSAERLADFTSVFGENLKLLDAQFVKFVRTAP